MAEVPQADGNKPDSLYQIAKKQNAHQGEGTKRKYQDEKHKSIYFSFSLDPSLLIPQLFRAELSSNTLPDAGCASNFISCESNEGGP